MQPTGIIGFSPSTPAAGSGRVNVSPATDAAFPIEHFSFAVPNSGKVSARTTTSETITQADQGKCLTFANASPITVTIDTPTDTQFAGNFMCFVAVTNSGTATFDPVSGTINGSATQTLTDGENGVLFWDGTNWEMLLINTGGSSGNATEIQSVPVSATTPTAGQVLEYNGSDWAPTNPSAAGLNRTAQIGIGAGGNPAIYSVLGDVLSTAGSSIEYANTGTTPNYVGCMQHTCTASTGSGSRINGSFFWAVGFDIQMLAYMAHDIVASIIWIGMWSATGLNVNTPGSVKGAGFRFSSTVPDTNYQCVTSDGSSATIVDSGVAANADTFHRFGLAFNDGVPNVVFSIDGSVVGTITTHLPATNTLLGFYTELYTQANVAKSIYVQSVNLQSNG